MCQKSKQHAPKGQKPIAQGNTLGKSITKTNAPCKGKSVDYQCFCPCRAFCYFQSVHPRRCLGLCAFGAFSPLCLTFDTSSCCFNVSQRIGAVVYPRKFSLKSPKNPLAFQKESFCIPNVVLLHSKRSPFALQK